MSLINDALKRAKQAQKRHPQPPPPVNVHVLPPAQAQPKQSDFSLLLLLALAGIFVLAGGLISFLIFRQPAATTADVTSLNRAPVAVPTSEKIAVSQPPPVVAAPPPRVVKAIEPELPTPNLPALQGIFYRPDHPTAIVDGKTVRPGSKVGDFEILAITFDTVVIGRGTQTNVLRLPE